MKQQAKTKTTKEINWGWAILTTLNIMAEAYWAAAYIEHSQKISLALPMVIGFACLGLLSLTQIRK